MLLSNYDVKQRLVDSMNDFFNQNPSFNKLKSLLIEQKPIASILDQIKQEILSLAEEEKALKRHDLAQKYLALQLTEDEKEQFQAPIEIEALTKEKEHLLEKQYILKDKIKKATILIQPHHTHVTVTAPVNMHHHTANHTHSSESHHRYGIHGVSHTFHNNTAAPPSDPFELLGLSQELAKSQNELTQNIKRMQEIDNSFNTLTQLTTQRAARGIARAQGSIEQSLSKSNKDLFTKAISEIDSALKSRAQILLNEAEEANYPVFMDQLNGGLHELALSQEETITLRAILDLMKKYTRQMKLGQTLNQELSLLEKKLSSEKFYQEELIEQVKKLTASLPVLTMEVQALGEEKNKEQYFLRSNMAMRNQLSHSTLILAGITFGAGIPLLLAGSNLLIILTPVVFASLYFIAPALLLTATIATGLAALTYAIKVISNSNTITAKSDAIITAEQQKNHNQAKINHIEENKSISECSETIEALKKEITVKMEERNYQYSQAEATLELAKETIPSVPYSNTPNRETHGFFSTSPAADSVSNHSNVIYVDSTLVSVVPENIVYFDEYQPKPPSAPSFN